MERMMTHSDLKDEIQPTMDHFSDPYVLQLIETISKQDDEIERLRDALRYLETWEEKHVSMFASEVLKGENDE
jgi:hypothetical protein